MAQEEAREEQKIGDMTRGELETLVAQMVDERMRGGWPVEAYLLAERTPENRAIVMREPIELTSGTPSILETLLEERDKWYKNT